MSLSIQMSLLRKQVSTSTSSTPRQPRHGLPEVPTTGGSDDAGPSRHAERSRRGEPATGTSALAIAAVADVAVACASSRNTTATIAGSGC